MLVGSSREGWGGARGRRGACGMGRVGVKGALACVLACVHVCVGAQEHCSRAAITHLLPLLLQCSCCTEACIKCFPLSIEQSCGLELEGRGM